MDSSPSPPLLNESARLDELRALQILDTSVEERFDQYTRLVADVLDVPTVLVSLVDAQRQWFKSVVGLDAKETSRDSSFCAHALPLGLLEIPDTHRDTRFKDNPLVTGTPFIRFYAGVVLHGPTGQPLGTLCVIDTRPRHLSETEKTRLKTFASLVEQELNRHTRFKTWAHEIQRTALYDAVTGLPEHGLLEDHLERTLTEARKLGQSVAVVHLHLTNFEALATLEGRRGSDRVLQEITRRLQRYVRPIDQVGRLGPDRLGLIMPGLDDITDTARRIRALVERLIAPVEVETARRPVHLTAGVSRFPADATTADALLDRARTAASEPASGRVEVHCYSKADHAQVSRRFDQMHRLAEALQTDALEQVYQPILSCQNRQMIGVEALARWNDGVYGSVSPGEFVPLAEADPELRRALTRWSLIRACRQLAEWQRQGTTARYIAVNIPGGELYQNDFVDLVTATRRQYGVAAERLVLEVTEQSLVTDIDTAIATMAALRATGVRFAVDDFGTGYSSLRYLQQLPLDILKIDRGFIQSIVVDPTTRTVTSGILTIAHTLGLTVVAEGVETVEQHAALQRLSCDYVQGYLFARPTAATSLGRTYARPPGS